MIDEALRMEDVHLSYNDLAGTIFSKPRSLGFFKKNEDDP